MVAALLTNDTSSSRRQNFLLRMAEYNFTAVHRKGELNRNADFFSRWARYKEYEDQQKAIPPVINMIIRDEVQWWKARKRCQQPGADQAAPGTGDDHGRVALAPVTSETLTSETLAQVNAILATTGIAPMLSEQERTADDSGLHEIPLPNTLETNKIRATIVAEQRKDPFLWMIIQKLLAKEAILETMQQNEQQHHEQQSRDSTGLEEDSNLRQSIELEQARAVAAPNNVIGESAMQEDKADDTMQSASNSASARVSNTLTASNTASASTGNDHSCATITVNGFAMNILRARRMAHYQGAEMHAIEADATESKESADDDAISRGETTDEDEDPKDATLSKQHAKMMSKMARD